MRHVLDTNILIDYLHFPEGGISAEAIITASQEDQLFYSIVSEMELWQHKGNKHRIQDEIDKIKELGRNYKIKRLYCSSKAQKRALELIEAYRFDIGKCFVFDCLIASTAIMMRAVLVTNDRNWFRIGKDIGLTVKTPVDIVEGF